MGRVLLRPIHDRQLREAAEGLAECAMHKVGRLFARCNAVSRGASNSAGDGLLLKSDYHIGVLRLW